VPHYPPGSDYELEETADELEFVENLFGATRAEAQPKAFRKLISKPGSFDLLHYAGHGFAEPEDIANAELMLEGSVSDGEWTPNYFTSTEVEGFCNLQQKDGGRPMVVLNACQAGRAGYKLTGIGGFSQAFLKGRAGAFVSSMWSVGDEPARYFTEALYKALDKGDRLANAVKKARKAARKAGDGTWLAYVVYGDPFATLERPD
jgi:CHAT domain-containing protein